ncbi:MAG TPA: FixH family protein [Burkholderiales bacterium]|nr:FixH family protein [Burkholderiales bacterium]
MNEEAALASPWYRDRWPWLIMSVPALSAVLGIVMLMLAIDSYDGLVAEDYYKQGLAINETLDKEAQAKRLGLSADLRIAEGTVQVILHGIQTNPGALKLRLAHPTRSGEDVTLRLMMTGVQTYSAHWPQMGPGRWHAMLEDEAGTWRIAETWQSGTQALMLRPKESP